MSSSTGGGQSRSLILTAMIFAVAMTFIDQTIVSIAAPTIQHDLGLSSSGMQWAINAYLLTLAAFFAFGGSGNIASIPQFIRADFAAATRDVLYGMCVIMAVAGLVALRGLKRGVQLQD